MAEASDSGTVYTRQRRIAQLAKQMPEKGLTSLNQHLDLEWLREAYRRTRKDGAVGIDGQTAADYERDLEGNLRSLLERAKSGAYWAPPVRRVHIPKGTGGETRPIGIPTLEDKVLQRAIAMLLEPIYEQDFYDCSYGFRPRRSAHDALDSLSKQTMWSGVSCIWLVSFRKPQGERKGPDADGPGTFDFLGFTHFWARSRKGTWILKRKTAASRFTRAVKTISQWCRFHRHDQIGEQHAVLCQKLQGHAGYYGITGNSPALARFRHAVQEVWRKWLMRRRRAWRASWDWFRQLQKRYPLPYLRAIHSVCRRVANG